jgi:hypothetical protein
MILLINEAIVILAADQPDRIRISPANWGRLTMRYVEGDEILRVAGISEAAGEMIINPALSWIRANIAGAWYRASEKLHALYARVARTNYPLPAEVFWASLDAEPDSLAGRDGRIVVTHCPRGKTEWAAWLLISHEAMPLEIEVVQPSEADPLLSLEPRWPLGDLTGEVAVVGTGSIGSAVALALAMYGVRKITLGVHSRGAGNWSQPIAGSGGSQGFPSMAPATARSAVMPWAAAVSR